jgi:hypothetical protein
MGFLFRAEVRSIKDFLQADDPAPFFGRVLNVLHVLLDHRLFDGVERSGPLMSAGGLD